MKKLLTIDELIAFEDDIAECFKNKQILAPIHLEWGNEKQLIEVFKHVNEEDWVCGSWRTHYKCLLKNVPKELVKKEILQGRSISLSFRDYRVISSAIVGGIVPIALGIAIDIKRKGTSEKVWCFVGDMTSTTGVFHESYQYALNHKLPITFVVEDNSKSVCTDTKEVWNMKKIPFDLSHQTDNDGVFKSQNLWYYKYDLSEKYPHAGPGGARIQF